MNSHKTLEKSTFITLNDPKLYESSVACFLNDAPIFDWYLVRWGSKDKEQKHTCLKREWTTSSNNNNYSTPHSITNIIGRTYVTSLKINKHALPITITKPEKLQFPIQFLQIFHRRFAHATQALLCKSNRLTWKTTHQITPTHLQIQCKGHAWGGGGGSTSSVHKKPKLWLTHMPSPH